jgi:hypothetical protein
LLKEFAGASMVSSTQQTQKIRHRKKASSGNVGKRLRRRGTTQTFPIHPEGYNPEAPDAKKPAK